MAAGRLAGVPFEPDIITASQWRVRHAGLPDSPEVRLAAAVLEQAVDDPVRWRRRGKERCTADAPGWFARTDRAWPFSFENLCELLELDADAVRREVMA
jgi:hypothetical protein